MYSFSCMRCYERQGIRASTIVSFVCLIAAFIHRKKLVPTIALSFAHFCLDVNVMLTGTMCLESAAVACCTPRIHDCVSLDR